MVRWPYVMFEVCPMMIVVTQYVLRVCATFSDATEINHVMLYAVACAESNWVRKSSLVV